VKNSLTGSHSAVVALDSPVNRDRLIDTIEGYPSTVPGAEAVAFTSVTSDYAENQKAENDRKTDSWLLPLLKKIGARRVLDAGCGVGQMVERLLANGVDAYGFDLIENVSFLGIHGLDPFHPWNQLEPKYPPVSVNQLVLVLHNGLGYLSQQSFDAAVNGFKALNISQELSLRALLVRHSPILFPHRFPYFFQVRWCTSFYQRRRDSQV